MNSIGYDHIHGNYSLPPVMRMWGAVRAQAVLDYLTYKVQGQHIELGQMAGCWIFDDSDCPRSFNWICMFLNQDPVRIRRELKERPREIFEALASENLKKHGGEIA